MKRLKLIVLLTLISSCILGQNVKIIDKNNDFNKTEEYKYFEYVYKDLEIPSNLKVATLKGFSVNSGSSTLVELFNSFWELANKLGANSFRIEDFSNSSSDTVYVTISVYKLGKEELDKNFIFYPKNKVYIFGDLDKKKQRGKTIVFNNEKIKLLPFEYVAHQNNVGEETIVSIGGLLGAKMWIRGKENRMPTHLSLTGFGIGPGHFGQIGVSINTGRIYNVDLNFGEFLGHLLKEKE